jgi:hypothetical protein
VICWVIRRAVAAALLLSACGARAQAVPETEVFSGVCKQPGETPAALLVRQVGVRGAWAGKIELPIRPGDPLTAENSSAAVQAVYAAISQDSALGYFQTLGDVEITVVRTECERSGPQGTVDFFLIPHSVRLSAVKVGDNVLPIARFGRPWATVPAPVRRLLPAVAAGYDRVQGSTASLALAPSFTPALGRTLSADLTATHAVQEHFFDDRAALNYDRDWQQGWLRSIRANTGYNRLREPLGDAVHESESVFLQLGATLKPAPNTRVYVNAAAARYRDRFAAADAQRDGEQSARLLYELIPPQWEGFARTALWLQRRDGYRQAALRAGYGKELALRPNQSLGLEVSVGAGKLFGRPPAYARFFGGAPESQFLYDGANAASLLVAPRGPVLRSFGVNGAQLAPGSGGERYWHVNVDLSIPVGAWSYPLVPNEVTDIPDADGNDLTLKQLLRRQIDVSGPSFLQETLVAQGMDRPQATKRAAEILGEVQPAAHYVIEQANVFAVKPFILIDAAGLSAEQSATWLAVGAGLQAIVLTARFEAGYAHTVHGPVVDDRGAFFARLVFQRLF